MSLSKAAESLLTQHPLQRLPSPNIGTSALIHILGLADFLICFKYIRDNPNHASKAYGWHFVFLTILALGFSTCTFTVGLLADVTLSQQLFQLKNLLSMCSVPLEFLVTTLYWTIRTIDPSLLNAPGTKRVPSLINHGLHLVPSVIGLVDILFVSPPWEITVLPSIVLSSVVIFGYWAWLEKCYSVNGWYAYPLLEKLDTKGRIMLFSTSSLIMAMNMMIIKAIYGGVNGF